MTESREQATPTPLNTSSETYFRDAYEDVMYTGAIGLYSKMVHRLMERPYRGLATPSILEVGAGAGQHSRFVSSAYSSYIETDLDAGLQSPSADPRLTRQQADAQDLSQFPDATFDRVIATCLLAHLPDPRAALSEWRRVTKPGGHITIYVPTEPGMLLRALRHAFVAPKSRRLGQSHVEIVTLDHRNHYPAMRALIRQEFAGDDVTRRRFPSRLLGWNFSLFEIFHITKG